MKLPKKIYAEIKNLLVLGPPYEDIDTIGLNLYVQNMWEIEKIQRKTESLSVFKNVSTILPLRRKTSTTCYWMRLTGESLQNLQS